MVDAIEDHLETVDASEWEQGFLEDVQKRLRQGRRLSVLQDDKLKEIIHDL